MPKVAGAGHASPLTRHSWVEAKMHCIQRLGERVMSRAFERQANEMHIRATILNRFKELSYPQTVAVA